MTMDLFPSNSEYLPPRFWSRYRFDFNLAEDLPYFVMAYFYFCFRNYSPHTNDTGDDSS